MDEGSLEVRFTLTADDFVDGFLLLRRRDRQIWLFGSLLAIAGGAIAWALAPAIALPAAIWIAFYSVIFLANSSRAGLRWQMRGRTRAYVGTECVVRLLESGVSVSQTGTTSETAWWAMRGLVENASSIALMTARSRGVVGIPRRAFATVEDFEVFRSVVVSRSGRPEGRVGTVA